MTLLFGGKHYCLVRQSLFVVCKRSQSWRFEANKKEGNRANEDGNILYIQFATCCGDLICKESFAVGKKRV